jgi:clan AA aspartic protease (TIGR02281 family)
MYQCLDASGASVFTDSPAQLSGCTVVNTSPPGPSLGTPSLPSPVAPRVEPEPGPASPAPDAEANGARPAGEVTVPIQRAGNLLVVQAQLNGSRDARLILDTGASHTILSYAVARDLGVFGDQRTTTVTLKTAGGPVQADVVRVDSIRLGDAEVRNSQAAIYDVPDAPAGVDGLLGLTFLHQFAVTLDVAKGQLHLRRRD